MFKLIICFFFVFNLLLSADNKNIIVEDDNIFPKVDCIILEDENSIICKFELKRSLSDEIVLLQWINPEGEVSRQRNMIIPAGHGSIYDYRYVEGRVSGQWTFQAIFKKEKYSTKFEIK